MVCLDGPMAGQLTGTGCHDESRMLIQASIIKYLLVGPFVVQDGVKIMS